MILAYSILPNIPDTKCLYPYKSGVIQLDVESLKQKSNSTASAN